MTGNTLNQPSGSEPVTTTAVGCLLTRLAEAGVASVFGVLDAIIAQLGPGHVGKSRLAVGPRADSALSSPAGRGLSISPPSPAPTWWRP